MKRYLFSDNDFEIIRLLKSKTPKKIWFNVIQYIIDYGDSYLKLEVKSTTDPSNYAITHTYESTISFSIEKSIFTPTELSIQLCENENINEIYIVRALIYHSIYRKLDKKEKKNFMSILNSIRPGKKDEFNALINNIEGVTNDFVVHPNSGLPQTIDSDLTNLVDVGLLICLKDRYIKAFIENNSDDFCNYNDHYIFESIDFTDINKQYDLIKFE
jgi:hypothetical protein